MGRDKDHIQKLSSLLAQEKLLLENENGYQSYNKEKNKAKLINELF